jgi:hypothetical protein
MGLAWPVGRILGHPAPPQGCSLPLASLRDGLLSPLTRAGPRPGACQQPGRRGRPCHLRAIRDGRSWFLTVTHGHSGHVDLRRLSIGEGRHEW